MTKMYFPTWYKIVWFLAIAVATILGDLFFGAMGAIVAAFVMLIAVPCVLTLIYCHHWSNGRWRKPPP